MKKGILFALVTVLGLTLACGVAFAGNPHTGNGAQSGQHYQFNIIGSTNGTSGDTSNGRTIFVPLHTQKTPDYEACQNVDDTGVTVLDDLWPNNSSTVPANNARIEFEVCQSCTNFEISDRDATDDGVATIEVPASMLDGSGNIKFDVYIRVLGKPLQCMEINGYAYDGNYYYKSGTVYLSKKHGGTTFVKVNDLFDVWYCDAYTNPTCTPTEISVFASSFQNYFWELYNDGTKLVQVRIYPN